MLGAIVIQWCESGLCEWRGRDREKVRESVSLHPPPPEQFLVMAEEDLTRVQR